MSRLIACICRHSHAGRVSTHRRLTDNVSHEQVRRVTWPRDASPKNRGTGRTQSAEPELISSTRLGVHAHSSCIMACWE